MSKVLLLTNSAEPAAAIVPSLGLLAHSVQVSRATAAAVSARSGADVILVDGRRDLIRARQLLLRLRRPVPPPAALILVVTERGWPAVTAEWAADEVILDGAGPGEIEARIRLAIGRAAGTAAAPGSEVRSGELVIDEGSYSARIRGASLDLTFKEFELLKFLAQHPRQVFTRSQLLQEVWGYDYFGGTRTVDVHVRRLRAKLGAGDEALIGTVRNVGYKFVPAVAAPARSAGLRPGRPGPATGEAGP